MRMRYDRDEVREPQCETTKEIAERIKREKELQSQGGNEEGNDFYYTSSPKKWGGKKLEKGKEILGGGYKSDLVELAQKYGFSEDDIKSVNDRGNWKFVIPTKLAIKVTGKYRKSVPGSTKLIEYDEKEALKMLEKGNLF